MSIIFNKKKKTTYTFSLIVTWDTRGKIMKNICFLQSASYIYIYIERETISIQFGTKWDVQMRVVNLSDIINTDM